MKKYAKDCKKDVRRVTGRLRNGLEFGVLASSLCVEIKNNDKTSAKKSLLDEFNDLTESIKKKVGSKREYEVKPEYGNIKETAEFEGDERGQKIKYLWCPVTSLIK